MGITQTQYDQMYDAYKENLTVASAARAAAVTHETATRYIEEGSSKFPAIKPRILALQESRIREQDRQYEKQLEVTANIANNLTIQLARALSNSVVVPKGKVVDGKTQISIHDANKFATTTAQAQQISDRVRMARVGNSPYPLHRTDVHVNVTQNNDNRSVSRAVDYERVESMMREGGFDAQDIAERPASVIKAIATRQSLRDGDGDAKPKKRKRRVNKSHAKEGGRTKDKPKKRRRRAVRKNRLSS